MDRRNRSSSLGPPATCKGICGKEIQEYVTTTQMRSLGGVSMDLRGQVKRDLFPYKPFPAMKECAHGAVYLEDCHVKPATDPKSSNESISEESWTDDEKHLFDLTLKGFARWEVDTGRRVVRATKCGGTTHNANRVCSACQDVESDAAFKKAVYRVSVQ